MDSPKIIFEGLKTPLICSCCGKIIDLEKESPMINLDPGCNNYPVAPDEPAEIYLECMECFLPLDIPERLNTFIDERLESWGGCISPQERDTFWEALRLFLSETGGN